MSPTVFKEKGYRFFFFSREESRKHIHVISHDGEAKVWLEPNIALAKSYGYSKSQINDIIKLIKGRQNELISAWKKHFSC